MHALGLNGPELEALARGIAVMKQRPESDPTSWLGQANVHLSAQHGNVHFLSWHRMYLYWFERILRQAAGDDTLTIPYWDYRVAGQRVLPAPFRDPSNALYIPQRNPQVNNGQQPPASIFNMPGTMGHIAFMHTGSGSSFGGSVSIGGGLEGAPHNGVHTWVGGEDGYMGFTRHSPKDPLFWLHHANIDRMWEEWLGLGGGRANTSDPTFLTTNFQFYDENGAAVNMTGSQVLDTAGQLGYRYDDQAAAAFGSFSAQGRSRLVAASKLPSTVVGATAKGAPVRLNRNTTRVAIPLAKSAAGALGAAGKGAKPKATLSLSGVAGAGVRGVMFNVFVGISGRGTNVGSLSLFGLQPDDHHGHGHTAGNMSFDISKAIAGAAEANKITVTLEPIDLTGTGSLPSGTLATIGRMVISVQGAKKKPKKKQTKQQRRKARLAKKAQRQKQKQQQKKQRTSPNTRKRTANPKQKRSMTAQAPVAQTAPENLGSSVPGNKSSFIGAPVTESGEAMDAGHAHH